LKTALLLSGGMDSLAIAWWKHPDIAITIDYGQKAAEAEKRASAAVCQEIGIEHHILHIDCSSLGSGDMVLAKPDPAAPASDWWPYRNQLLITLAAMKCIGLGVQKLLIGTVLSDGSHIDGTPEFVQLMDKLLRLQEGGLQVEAPAIGLSTADIIRQSELPPGILAWAHSCHKANTPCWNCRGCNKYRETYDEIGLDLA